MATEKAIQKPDNSIQDLGLDIGPGDVFLELRYGKWYRLEGIQMDDTGVQSFVMRWRLKDGQWSSRTSIFSRADLARCVQIHESIEDFEAEALEAMRDPSKLNLWEGKETSETALVQSAGKDHLLSLRDAMDSQVARVEAIQAVMRAKMSHLSSIAGAMQRQLGQIKRVIGAIEMYIGVHEEIVQIRDGLPAPMDTPIVFRQLVLFMDEECGDPRWKNDQPGIDFRNVEDFDAWVIQPANLARILPHEKGVVALQPSRQERSYTNNVWINAEMKVKNKMTYLLIRNGECVYRIWTGTSMGTKLFPGPEEIQKVFDRVERGSEFGQEQAKNLEFSYQRKGLLLQGLLDRTDVFKPMNSLVNLFDPDTYAGLIEFVFDAEPALLDGRLRYREWKDGINKQIQRGSRILLAIHRPIEQGASGPRRFLRYYRDGAEPSPPGFGVYKVEEVHPPSIWDKREKLIIRYNPDDTVYSSWSDWRGHKRKNRVSYIAYRSDTFVLNYDLIDLETVENFIDSRLERRQYLNIIPLLWEIRDRRLAELEWEKHFVVLMANETGAPEEKVWDAVVWWKTKNIWKRPIMEDDAKALRMIRKRLEREMQE